MNRLRTAIAVLRGRAWVVWHDSEGASIFANENAARTYATQTDTYLAPERMVQP